MATSNFSDDWFVGFSDGDGCFYLNDPIYKNAFIISQHERSKNIVYAFLNRFKCGNVTVPIAPNKQYYYTVGSQDDLKNIIFPFFLAHPLQTLKNRNNFKTLYEGVTGQPIPAPYNNIKFPMTINENWLAGFIDSEGHFNISISFKRRKVQFQIQLGLQSSDKPTLDAIANYLNYGTVFKKTPKQANIYYSFEIKDRLNCRKFLNLLQVFPNNYSNSLLKGVKEQEVIEFEQGLTFCESNLHIQKPNFLNGFTDGLQKLAIIQQNLRNYRVYTKKSLISSYNDDLEQFLLMYGHDPEP